jgi:hypothetical protein
VKSRSNKNRLIKTLRKNLEIKINKRKSNKNKINKKNKENKENKSSKTNKKINNKRNKKMNKKIRMIVNKMINKIIMSKYLKVKELVDYKNLFQILYQIKKTSFQSI